MISLERLLDGLEIAVEPLRVYDPHPQQARDRRGASSPTVRSGLKGSGAVLLVGGATLRLTPVSLTVEPASSAKAKETPKLRSGGGDPDVIVATGRIRASYQGSVELFDHVATALVEALDADDPIRRFFEDLLDEIAAQRPGARAMVETLLRACLILLLRRYAEHDGGRLSWFAELEDERLVRAVNAMRDEVSHPFTLAELAKIAGMSRSVFASRFAGAHDKTPLEFLKAMRLARAAQLLTRTDLSVKTVAARVGYSSRSSFTHAFLATHRVGPTAFRAAVREPALPERGSSDGPAPVNRRGRRRDGARRRSPRL